MRNAKLGNHLKNKVEAEILKRIDIILCVETSVNTIQFYDYSFVIALNCRLSIARVLSFSIRLFLCEMLFSKPKRPSII